MKRSYYVVPVAAAVVLAGLVPHARPQSESAALPYKNPKLPVEQRVADLLRRMTLEEKASLLSGSGWMQSRAVDRLGIPAIRMADGPMGVRSWLGPTDTDSHPPGSVYSTALPAGLAMAAAWNPELIQQVGKVIAEEVKALGRDMILAPTVNISRVPLWGRNFESYGEDPYLTARLAVAFIKGAQGEGVISSVKHFAANNQEYEKHRIDEKVDERTLHEIYFPAFKAAVQEAGAWAVMSAYNKVNGLYCAENPYLLRDVLKQQWGFKGFVVSDWGSTYSTAGTVNAGLDLEMPGGEPMMTWFARPSTRQAGNGAGWLVAEKILAGVKAGQIAPAAIDDNAGRILRTIFTSGLFDRPQTANADVDTPQHRLVARAAATQGIVLLKNEAGVLPLNPSTLHSLAVIGPNAAVARTGGGGSSAVRPEYAIAPLDGIRERAGTQVEVRYALGVSMEGDSPANSTPAAQIRLRDEAAAVAAKADAAVVVVGYTPSLELENFDRKSMDLPRGQDELIQAVTNANKNTIVVLNAGAPVTMEKWVAQVPAILNIWYSGQEGGHALADILFGDANPSGKLPLTFPRQWKDSPAYDHYPGENLHVEYAEGIYVGYRYFDARRVEPLFPFGHGLSYTRFDYGDLKIAPARVTPGKPVEVNLQVRNGGSRAGAEVVQLYIHDVQSSLDRPPKELKGFRRVVLEPGVSQTVSFTLDPSAMAFYSVAKKDWVAEPGTFEVLIGSSSRDIRLKGTFELLKQAP